MFPDYLLCFFYSSFSLSLTIVFTRYPVLKSSSRMRSAPVFLFILNGTFYYDLLGAK